MSTATRAGGAAPAARTLTLDAERGGVVDGGGMVGHAARVGAAVPRRQVREHQQRELVQALLFYLQSHILSPCLHTSICQCIQRRLQVREGYLCKPSWADATHLLLAVGTGGVGSKFGYRQCFILQSTQISGRHTRWQSYFLFKNV